MTGPRPTRRWVPLTLTVVFLLVAGTVIAVQSGFGPGAATACLTRTPVTITSSSEKSKLLTELAERYNTTPRTGDACARVEVSTVNSGEAATAFAKEWDEATYGPRPDVWSPAASTWIPIARGGSETAAGVVPESGPSIARTPLVIAMPRPMAEALGWPDAPLGWGDLVELSRNPARVWADRGHPEWGAFRLGKTNPTVSTSGLHSMLSAYHAAPGGTGLSPEKIAGPQARAFEKAIESNVVHYGPTELTFLQNLYNADQRGRGLSYISAVAVEEKSVLDYNQGNPRGDPATATGGRRPAVPLAAFVPKDGTMVSDSPYLVLDAPWVTEQKRAAAEDFRDWLLEAGQQSRFQEAGFRDAEGTPGPVVTQANGMLPDAGTALPEPDARVVADTLASWADVRRRANVLLVIDRSGSMGVGAGGRNASESNPSLLARTVEAASASVDLLAPDDTIGLWSFSSAASGLPYSVDVPPGRVDATLPALRAKLGALKAAGGTALYQTTQAAVDELRRRPDPGRINAVVLLTDGQNEDTPVLDDAPLLADLATPGKEQIRVFSIAFTDKADLDALQRIGQSSGGTAYGAQDPNTIEQVFRDVLANF